MAKALTAAAVKKYRGGRARREIRDGAASGLYLIVQPSGHKSWALRYRRPSGVPAKMTLGTVDTSEEPDSHPVLGAPLTLASARAVAAEQLRKRATGVDVAAHYLNEKRHKVQVRADAASNSFAALAKRFIEEYARREQRRWRGTAKYLGFDYPKEDGAPPTLTKRGLAERWRDRLVTSIDGGDLYGVVDEARRISIPGLKRRRRSGLSDTQGRALASVLSTLFAWLVEHRHITANPALGMYKPGSPQARDRVLNVKADLRRADELRVFWSACDEVGAPFGQLLRLLLLTGCRLNELAAVKLDELGDDFATLRLPASRTKNHRPHDVYLAPLARDILASVTRFPDCPYVFSTDGKSCVAGFSHMKKRLDAAMLTKARAERGKDAVIEPWRLHDLRRTFATGAAGIGVPPHIVEAALNHVSGAKAGVAGTYNRAAYEAETRDAWEQWAERVEALVTGQTAKVLKLHPRGGAA